MKPFLQIVATFFAQQLSTASVVLSRSGQKTNRPQVHISVASKRGAATVMTQPDTVKGNAWVKMYGQIYADILGIPLSDERKR